MAKQAGTQSSRQRQTQTQEQVARQLNRVQLIQSRMLRYNPVEMELDVRHHIEDNPALEAVIDKDSDIDDNRDFTERDAERQRDDYWDADDDPGEGRYRRDNGTREAYVPQVSATPTLADYLEEQLIGLKLNDEQQHIMRYIFGCLDNKGYLCDNVQRITMDLGDTINVTEREVADMVNLVRDTFEPAGIAAFNLQDCLLLQLERLPVNGDTDMAFTIVDEHFTALLQEDYSGIARALGTTEDEVRRVTRRVLGKLRHSPAQGFDTGSNDHADQIVPQFIIRTDDDGTITAEVNNRFPELQVSQSYSAVASQVPTSGKANSQLTDIKRKVESATFYIEMIKMRQQTLLRIIGYIVNHQREYLLSGDEADLHPLVLSDISKALGMDTSTVSRATGDQWVDTPYGIKPMRIFFGNGSGNVKAAIKALVEGEDKSQPLTDAALAQHLSEQGFNVSRRTVVKYREALNIPNSVTRKQSKQ